MMWLIYLLASVCSLFQSAKDDSGKNTSQQVSESVRPVSCLCQSRYFGEWFLWYVDMQKYQAEHWRHCKIRDKASSLLHRRLITKKEYQYIIQKDLLSLRDMLSSPSFPDSKVFQSFPCLFCGWYIMLWTHFQQPQTQMDFVDHPPRFSDAISVESLDDVCLFVTLSSVEYH
jgi:hypothetical protein